MPANLAVQVPVLGPANRGTRCVLIERMPVSNFDSDWIGRCGVARLKFSLAYL